MDGRRISRIKMYKQTPFVDAEAAEAEKESEDSLSEESSQQD